MINLLNLVPVSNNKEETFQFILDSKKCKYFISVIAKVFGCFKENEIEYTHFYDNTQNFFSTGSFNFDNTKSTQTDIPHSDSESSEEENKSDDENDSDDETTPDELKMKVSIRKYTKRLFIQIIC